MRKGYNAEYLAKKILQKKYGEDAVVKIAIGQMGADFLVWENKRIIKLVEVKESHKKKWYINEREKKQIERIKQFCKKNELEFEIWIKYPRKEFEIHTTIGVEV